jgi:anti-sigma B factor antagonist
MGNPPPDEQLLTLSIQELAGACIVTAEGVVDMMTAPRLRAALIDCVDRKPKAIIVDLAAVTMFGSHGLSVLAFAKDQAQHHDEPFRVVVDANRPVIRPIQLTGLDRVLALYHSLPDALRGTAPLPPP